MRVRIVGPHPWSECTGVVIDAKEGDRRLPDHLRVRLDAGQACPQVVCWVPTAHAQYIRNKPYIR